MKIFKILISYWFEILAGIFILVFTEDIRYFLFYFLIIFLLTLELRVDYLRKIIRVFQAANEIKLKGIIKKLNITEGELLKIGDDIENNLTEEEKKSLIEDLKDLKIK